MLLWLLQTVLSNLALLLTSKAFDITSDEFCMDEIR